MVGLDVHMIISFTVGSALGLTGDDMVYFLASNLVDVDHLTAKPIYDPSRSSFVHPLHKSWAAVCLAGGLINIWLGAGLALHFYVDYLDATTEGDINLGMAPLLARIESMR